MSKVVKKPVGVARVSRVKDENGLTVGQEEFCRNICAGMTTHDAYRQAYKVPASTPQASVTKRAAQASANPLVRARIDAIKAQTMKRHNITIDMLLEELEEARIVALKAKIPQAGAAISATMGKAKLCGLEKQVLVHVGADGKSLPPTRIVITAAKKPGE